jgi:hypothetical protein
MIITKSQLRKIIKEEIENIVKEQGLNELFGFGKKKKPQPLDYAAAAAAARATLEPATKDLKRRGEQIVGTIEMLLSSIRLSSAEANLEKWHQGLQKWEDEAGEFIKQTNALPSKERGRLGDTGVLAAKQKAKSMMGDIGDILSGRKTYREEESEKMLAKHRVQSRRELAREPKSYRGYRG